MLHPSHLSHSSLRTSSSTNDCSCIALGASPVTSFWYPYTLPLAHLLWFSYPFLGPELCVSHLLEAPLVSLNTVETLVALSCLSHSSQGLTPCPSPPPARTFICWHPRCTLRSARGLHARLIQDPPARVRGDSRPTGGGWGRAGCLCQCKRSLCDGGLGG